MRGQKNEKKNDKKNNENDTPTDKINKQIYIYR